MACAFDFPLKTCLRPQSVIEHTPEQLMGVRAGRQANRLFGARNVTFDLKAKTLRFLFRSNTKIAFQSPQVRYFIVGRLWHTKNLIDLLDPKSNSAVFYE